MTIPKFIDNLAFAKKQDKLSGNIQMAECERLADLLQHGTLSPADTAKDNIQYVLQGATNSLSQHHLHLSINAQLTTPCQRCLAPTTFALNLNYIYRLENIADHEVEESDDVDLLAIDQTMDVNALIEDELLTALPIAPTHEAGCMLKNNQSGKAPNPFDALKALIKP